MFRVNNLTGFGGGGPETFNYARVFNDTAEPSAESVTFTSASLGTPHPNRLLIVMIGMGVSGWSGDASVTIGGISTTLQVEYSTLTGGAGSTTHVAYLALPTGSAADIVVSGPGGTTITDISISVFRVCGPTLPAIYDHAGDASDPCTPSLNTPSGTSAVLMVAMSHNTTTLSWSGGVSEVGTEDQVGSTITVGYGAGYSESEQIPISITGDFGTGAQVSSIAISAQ